MRFIPALFILFCYSILNGQQRELNNSHVFKNGIYLSYVDFAKDSPSLRLSAAELKELEGSEYNFKIFEMTAKADSLFTKNTVWGICIDGIPYINCLYGEIWMEFSPNARKFIAGFSRIQTIGSICLIAEAPTRQTNPDLHATLMFGMAAYGIKKPKYGSGRFTLKILSLNTGIMLDFTDENLQQLISNDAELSTQLSSARKPKEQMFIVLKKYNERYPFYLN